MIELENHTDQLIADRIERQRQRDLHSPICSKEIETDNGEKETCGIKTTYVIKCSSYVCPSCQTHYHLVNGLACEIRFCWCGWQEENFSPLDAGESMNPEEPMFEDEGLDEHYENRSYYGDY